MKTTNWASQSRISFLQGAINKKSADLEIRPRQLATLLEIDPSLMEGFMNGKLLDNLESRMALQRLYWLASLPQADNLIFFGNEPDEVARWPQENMPYIRQKRRELEEMERNLRIPYLLVNAVGMAVGALLLTVIFIFMAVSMYQLSAPLGWIVIWFVFLILPALVANVAYTHYRQWQAYRRKSTFS